MKITEQEKGYIIWQNKATDFYISSRALIALSLWGAAAFCSQQCLETLLKATLIYWDKSFEPLKARHRFTTMLRTLENKVTGASEDIIPSYFYYDQLYQSASRYPDSKSGGSIGIFNTFLPDLDRAFTDLVLLVPFQFNSQLLSILLQRNEQVAKHYPLLIENNSDVERLSRFIFERDENSALVRNCRR